VNNNFIEKISLNLKNTDIKDGSTLILALSGGVDSTALLLALGNIKSRYNLKIISAHFNHNLRGKESDRDEKFSSDLSNRIGIKFVSNKLNLKQDNKSNKLSENTMRDLRYNFLQDTADKYNAKGVLTAHTENDQAETVLMSIIRGTGIRGISGMKSENNLSTKNDKEIKIYRLMLNITHEQCKNFCSSLGIKPMMDSSNLKNIYLRNFIRNNTIPRIEKDFPNFTKKLSLLSQNSRKELDLKDWAIKKYYPLMINEDCSIKKNQMFLLPESLQYEIIIKHIENLFKQKINIENNHINEIIKLVKSSNSGEIYLPNNINIISKKNKIKIFSRIKDNPQYPLIINEPIRIISNHTKLDENHLITKKIIKRPNNLEKIDKNLEVYLRSDFSEKEFYFRKNIKDDLFQPLGMNKKIRLKKFLKNNIFDIESRKKIPVLTYKDQIAWVPGSRPAEWAKVNKEENFVLHFIITKINESV
tara:strand:- start:78427 stop:79848 length:1422 start_codon:yes stop_codon:yes gene_type:complete